MLLIRCSSMSQQSYPKSIYLITGFSPTIFKSATKINKIIYFVICTTAATQIFCSFGSICYLVFFIFVRKFILEVQIFKLIKTDGHFSFLYKQMNTIYYSSMGLNLSITSDDFLIISFFYICFPSNYFI